MVRRLGAGIAGAAVLIGVITVLARVTGFAKQLAFARTVGTNCLATAYYTANQVPNIVFEVVAGGALAGMAATALARQVVSAFTIVLHLERGSDGRRRIACAGRFVLESDRLGMEEVQPW